jgi:hypothetical protein
MDIGVDCTKENYDQLGLAFHAFKKPVFDITLDRFLQKEAFAIFRLGRKPVAIDIMTEMAGLDFTDCYLKAHFFVGDDLKLPVE